MTVNIIYTAVTYSVYKPDNDNPDIARKVRGVLNIYDGRATKARIERELPKGATVESVRKFNRRFNVDGEKILDWLIDNDIGCEKSST